MRILRFSSGVLASPHSSGATNTHRNAPARSANENELFACKREIFASSRCSKRWAVLNLSAKVHVSTHVLFLEHQVDSLATRSQRRRDLSKEEKHARSICAWFRYNTVVSVEFSDLTPYLRRQTVLCYNKPQRSRQPAGSAASPSFLKIMD